MVLGNNNSNIPSLIRIISEAFLKDAIDRSHAVAQRMIMIVKQIQVNLLKSNIDKCIPVYTNT